MRRTFSARRLQRFLVAEQCHYLVAEFLTGIGIENHHCGIALYESLGILALMILGHIGRRNQHNGKTDKLQLGDGTRSGT